MADEQSQDEVAVAPWNLTHYPGFWSDAFAELDNGDQTAAFTDATWDLYDGGAFASTAPEYQATVGDQASTAVDAVGHLSNDAAFTFITPGPEVTGGDGSQPSAYIDPTWLISDDELYSSIQEAAPADGSLFAASDSEWQLQFLTPEGGATPESISQREGPRADEQSPRNADGCPPDQIKQDVTALQDRVRCLEEQICDWANVKKELRDYIVSLQGWCCAMQGIVKDGDAPVLP